VRIRTITTGLTLAEPNRWQDALAEAATFNSAARELFEERGYVVQTTRVSTNPWGEYFQGTSGEAVEEEARRLESLCGGLGIDFLSVGYCRAAAETRVAHRIVGAAATLSCGARLGDSVAGIDRDNARSAARAIRRIAESTDRGYGNFRFCGWANCPPHTPFFPTAYHQGPPGFSIGLECSDLVASAFSEPTDPTEASRRLRSLLVAEFSGIDALATELSEKRSMSYHGLDASVAPSTKEAESIALACEAMGLKRFGYSGTLSVVAIITGVLRDLPVKTCGYSGLMLPVCEDWGLAQRAGDGAYGLADLLLYSAVCGCGLDAVPLPGDTPVAVIESILLDVATLAVRLSKPLSARLLPVPGKSAGEMTDFGSPYLIDSAILPVR
jgi:uncharacterized protein (UPF0210 family)